MKIAFVVFDRMTSLDFVGFYDPVTRLKSMKILDDVEWRICSTAGSVLDVGDCASTPMRWPSRLGHTTSSSYQEEPVLRLDSCRVTPHAAKGPTWRGLC